MLQEKPEYPLPRFLSDVGGKKFNGNLKFSKFF